ncbi:hypothetical protein PR202_gb28659 [Eleusine coracana subsp. coracana]|uniref:Uncharacterized protein n=1 Tax=Eleusine coracana subsp. coracana TaxID=191504 RepID=A0AAV5FV41_ELECO|nr:hypothetical protein PR202_gb28659 [Eleusine coracana subsp. coracana]
MADGEEELDVLAEKLRLTPDVLRGPEMPAILANLRDGELVEVVGELAEAGGANQKWARVANYGSLESICQSETLLGFSLGIYLMPYYPVGEVEQLRSGVCKGVSFTILNQGMLTSKLLAASSLRNLIQQPTLLLSKVDEAVEELIAMGCSNDMSSTSNNYLGERKAANLAYFRALLNEGVDPHNTILAIDSSMHKDIYCQSGVFDPCELDLDSNGGCNLTSMSLLKLTEDVTAGNRKTELRRILSFKGKIVEDSINKAESKLLQVLKEFQHGLKNHIRKMEAQACAPSVIGCGYPRK